METQIAHPNSLPTKAVLIGLLILFLGVPDFSFAGALAQPLDTILTYVQ